MDDEGLERLLDYDRRRFWLVNDWSVRFRIYRVSASAARAAGIKYSFTLHDDCGMRLLGFDNAHAIGGSVTFDHRHRFRKVRFVKSYEYRGADTLLSDFFAEVERACEAEGIPFEFDDVDIVEESLAEDEKEDGT